MRLPEPITRFSDMAAMALNAFTQDLDGNQELNGRMRVVIANLEILETIFKNGRRAALEEEGGERSGLAAQLLSNTVDLVEINMAVAARTNAISRFEIALLADH